MKSFEKCLPCRARAAITGLTVLAVIGFASSLAVAAAIGEGPTLVQYSIVSVGSNASIMVNSGPIIGTVLVGDGSTVMSSGGNNGQITTGVQNSGAASGCGTTGTSCFSMLQIPPTVTVVSPTIGAMAFSEAAELSADASALTPTLGTFTGSFSGAHNFIGTGGLNVIDFASLQNPHLTFTGTANDIFVINVSGEFNTNLPITLNGVLASHIIWNFTGTGTVFQTSGGDVLYGTFLATKGGNFQFSELQLTGQLINTAGHIQWVSSSRMLAFAPFIPRETTPPPVIPEPSSLLLMGTGLIAGAGVLRRKAAKFRQCAAKVL